MRLRSSGLQYSPPFGADLLMALRLSGLRARLWLRVWYGFHTVIKGYNYLPADFRRWRRNAFGSALGT